MCVVFFGQIVVVGKVVVGFQFVYMGYFGVEYGLYWLGLQYVLCQFCVVEIDVVCCCVGDVVVVEGVVK